MKCEKFIEKITTVTRKTLEKILLEIKSNKIVAIYLAGSLIRGDFIPGISDIDIFIIYNAKTNEPVWEEESFQIIKNVLENELIDISKIKPYRELDICTLTTGEITTAATNPDGFSFIGPRKYLGIYSFDFSLNTKLLVGEDILQKLVVHEPQKFISTRLAILHSSFKNVLENKLLTKNEREYRLLLLLGGFVRLMCIMNGVKSFHKKEILDCFKELVYDFPQKTEIIMIFEEYFRGIPYQKTLKQFISFEEFVIAAVEQMTKVLKKHFNQHHQSHEVYNL